MNGFMRQGTKAQMKVNSNKNGHMKSQEIQVC